MHASCTMLQVNDYPEFLSGEERANTQHIVIRYYTPDLKKKKPKTKSEAHQPAKKPTSAQPSSSSQQSSKTSRTNSVVHLDRSLLTSRSTDSLGVGGSWQWQRKASSLKVKGSKEYGKLTRTQSVGTGSGMIGGAISPRGKHLSVPPATSKSSPKLSASKSDSNLAPETTTTNLASTMRNRYASASFDAHQKKPRPLPNPAEEWDENGEFLDKRKREPLNVTYGKNGELKLDLGKLETNSDDDYDESEEVDRNSLAPPSGGSRRKLSIGSTSSHKIRWVQAVAMCMWGGMGKRLHYLRQALEPKF